MPDEIYLRRQESVDRDGSPYFPHSFGVIANGAFEQVNYPWDYPASRKYYPLLELILTNNADEVLDVEINGDSVGFLAPGAVRAYKRQAVETVRIINNDSTSTSSGEVRALAYTPALDADEKARRGG